MLLDAIYSAYQSVEVREVETEVRPLAKRVGIPDEQTEVAIESLVRLGLISAAERTYGGFEKADNFRPTAIGRGFVRACRRPSESTDALAPG
jgi:hypothetical protein